MDKKNYVSKYESLTQLDIIAYNGINNNEHRTGIIAKVLKAIIDIAIATKAKAIAWQDDNNIYFDELKLMQAYKKVMPIIAENFAKEIVEEERTQQAEIEKFDKEQN